MCNRHRIAFQAKMGRMKMRTQWHFPIRKRRFHIQSPCSSSSPQKRARDFRTMAWEVSNAIADVCIHYRPYAHFPLQRFYRFIWSTCSSKMGWPLPRLRMFLQPSIMRGSSSPTSHLYLELFSRTPSLGNSRLFSTFPSCMPSARQCCRLALYQIQSKEFQECHKCECTEIEGLTLTSYIYPPPLAR